MRAAGALFAALAVAWAAACANQGAPPGGPQDLRPPVVVRTEPDTFAVLENLDSQVRFFFDERISESVSNGSLDDAVTVSPLTGEVRVHHGSRSLSVELRGGFRPGLVYRVTLLPVVSDLFNNQMREPFELVFSTGGTRTPNAVAGQVWDRISGQGVNGALVQAVGADSLVYVSRADEQGIFAFRYLPAGTFALTAFQDVDRNGELGERETQGSVVETVGASDTLLVDIPVLAPDTTPAVELRASALDSVTAVVEFDDYLDPTSASSAIGVTLSREDGPAPGVTRVFLEREYAAYVDQVTDSFARLDSIDAAAQAARQPQDTATAPDSLSTTLAPADTIPVAGPAGANVPAATGAPQERPRRQPPPRLQGGGGGRSTAGVAPGRVLPGRRVVALLDGPLSVGVDYQVSVTSVVNVNGLGGGGGEVTLTRQAPPPPDSTAAPIRPDSAGIRPDSAAVLPAPGPNR